VAISIVIVKGVTVEAVLLLLMRAHYYTYCWSRIVRVPSLLEPPSSSKGRAGSLTARCCTNVCAGHSYRRHVPAGPLHPRTERTDSAIITSGVRGLQFGMMIRRNWPTDTWIVICFMTFHTLHVFSDRSWRNHQLLNDAVFACL